MRPPYSRLFVVALLLVLLAALFSSAAAQTAPAQGAPPSPLAPREKFDPLSQRVSVVHTRDADGNPVDRYYAPDATGRMVEVQGEKMITGGPNGIRTVTVPPGAMASRAAGAQAPAAADAPAITGAQPWITVMCKFADVVSEPKNLAYFTNQYGATYPGLNHYFKEASYNAMNLNGSTAAGWFTLPNDRSYYVDEGSEYTDFGSLYYDCLNAADSSVNFSNYKGFNLVFNDDIRWSGADNWCESWEGDYLCRPTTWIEPSDFDNNGVAYEMAAAYHMPHAYAYDWWGNPWDLTSDRWSYCGLSSHATYGCLPQHVNGGSRALQGWTPAGRIVTVPNSGVTTVNLDRSTQPPGATNKLLVKVPILGYSNHYITVESRQKVGYDAKLPGQGVILHDFSDWGWSGQAALIDGDWDADPADAEAIWLPGETYDTGYGSAIQVVKALANGGYQVKVTTTGVTHDWFEQNDTRQTATDYGEIDFSNTYIWSSDLTVDLYGVPTLGDADFYTFKATAGDYIGIDVLADRIGSPLDAKVDLYNAAGTLLASNIDYKGEKDPYIEYQLPAAGVYYVRVTPETNIGGPQYLYDLQIRRATPPDAYEPNNSMAQATALAYGSFINATMPYGRELDVDYYKFNGQAGDAIGIRVSGDFHKSLSLYAPNGDPLDEYVHCFTDCDGDEYIFRPLDVAGTYVIKVEDAHGGTWPAGGSYSLVVDKPVFVSSSQSGKVAGITFTPSDVLLNWPNANQWQMFFDGSDVGVTRNVASLGVTRWGDLILGFGADQPIPYLWDWNYNNYFGATTLKTHDLAWFYAYQLGDVTSGDLLWLLDGSDVGLTVASEKIDAVAVDSDGRLLVSLFGAGAVPGVNAIRDEDILAFQFQHPGADTTGTWSLYLQGSTIPGITLAQDVVGLAQTDPNRLYMVMESAYTNIGGLTCGPTCVILRNAGVYNMVWDGRAESFNFKVDAVELPNVNELYINPYP